MTTMSFARCVRRARTTAVVALALIMIAAVSAGCSLNPGSMASSARSAGSGATMTIQFANTLNLPEGADVLLNGLRVGSVRDVTLRGDRADVVATLDENVRIAADATATIRQNTILGDPYLAVESPTSGAELRDGLIPLSRTTSPPPLEDTLAVIANFVNGGSIQNIQDVMRSVNKSLPQPEQTIRVADIAATDLGSLAADTGRIDAMIGGLDATSRAVIPHLAKSEEIFSPAGMHYWRQLSKLFGNIGVVLPGIGSVYAGGYWLLPMLTAVDGSIHTVRDGIDAVGANDQLIRKFLGDNLFPFMSRPGVNIVSARSPQGQEMIGSMTTVLRMLGAIR